MCSVLSTCLQYMCYAMYVRTYVLVLEIGCNNIQIDYQCIETDWLIDELIIRASCYIH